MRFLLLIGIGTVCSAMSPSAALSLLDPETSETGRRNEGSFPPSETFQTTRREEACAAVTSGAWNFAIDLYKNIGNCTHGSFASSPLSVSVVLTMASIGARKKTRASLLRVLGVADAPPDTVRTGYKYLIGRIANDQESGVFLTNDVESTLEGARPKGQFFRRSLESVRASQRPFDHRRNDSEPTWFARRWIDAQRSFYDCHVIGLGQVTFDPTLVLSSALYFAGGWERPFDENLTEMRHFWYNGAVSISVPTMHARRVYRYGELPELRSRFVQLPYKGSSKRASVSMFVILPDAKDGLAYLEENLEKLSAEKLYRSNFKIVDLYLPRFKVENILRLKETLRTMGLTDVFAKSANFIDISRVTSFVGNAMNHAAVLETSHTGTNLGMSLKRLLPSIYIDEPDNQRFYETTNESVRFVAEHPFIALVLSRESDTTRERPIVLLSARFTGH